MKKQKRSLHGSLLIAALLLSMTGCEEPAIVGTWETKSMLTSTKKYDILPGHGGNTYQRRRGNMKQFKIILSSMLLIALLLVAAAGCKDEIVDGKAETSSRTQTTSEATSETSSEDTGFEGEMAALVGSWTTTLDMAGFFNESIAMEGDEDIAEYVKIEKLDLTITFTFNEDGTFSTAADEDALSDTLVSLREELREGYTKYFEHMLKTQGLDMTVDDMLASIGMTMDELLDTAMIGFGNAGEAFNMTSEWKAENGKLYMGNEEDGLSETEYFTYELSDNMLSLNEVITEETLSAAEENLFPIILTKVA